MAPSALPASPDDPPPVETGSWLTSFGSVVGASTLGSTIATAPALLRLEGAAGVCSPFGAWAVLIAATVLPMSIFVLALRRARGGFLAFGKGKDGVPRMMLLGWIGSTFSALAFVGALLRARTHHHALAGVTFAISGLVFSLVLALVWARLAVLARRAPASGRGLMAAAIGVVLALAILGVRHGLTRESAAPLLTLQDVKLVDGLAFAVGALVASRRPFVNRGLLALIGPPLAAVVFVLGASSLRACPSLLDALAGQAPGVSWAIGLLCSN
jgi:hypothetical protein